MCRNENVPHEFHTKRKLINGFMHMILNFILSIYNSSNKFNSIKKKQYFMTIR